MIRRTAIATTTLVALLAMMAAPLTVQAENTQSTNTQQSSGGPLKKLHQKIRNMRPRVRMRKALMNKNKGSNQGASTTPATAPDKK